MQSTPMERRCPACGHRFPPAAAVCPNCGRDDANPFVSPAMEPSPLTPEWRWLAAAAAGVCGVAGLLALVAPGLSILLLVLGSPILARTWAAMERRREAGLPVAAGERLRAVAASTGIGLLAALAATIAFAAVCVPIGLSFSLIQLPQPDSGVSISLLGIIMAFVAGGVAGIYAGYYVFRRTWPRSLNHNAANTGNNDRQAH